MERSVCLNLLKVIKENNYIERYKRVFNKDISLNKILSISDSDALKIIKSSFTDSACLLSIYETLNKKEIDKNIKEKLFNVSDEVLTYSISILSSNIIEDKEDYIRVIKKGKSESIKYAHYLTTREDIVNHERGLNIVNLVGRSNKDVAVYFRNIFTSEGVLDNKSFNEFFNLILNIKNTEKLEYIYKICSNENLVKSPYFLGYITSIVNTYNDEGLRNLYKTIFNLPIKEEEPRNDEDLLEKYINEDNIDEVISFISRNKDVKIKTK